MNDSDVPTPRMRSILTAERDGAALADAATMAPTIDSSMPLRQDSPMPISPDGYPEEYFKTGNYLNYLHREESVHRMAFEICGLLDQIGIQSFPKDHLDWGCGPGFFVRGMSKAHWHSTGYDTSKWAIEQAKTYPSMPFRSRYLMDRQKALFDNYTLCTCLDVLEHMEFQEVCGLFKDLQARFLLVRIPVAHKNHAPMVLPMSRNDETHITRLTKETWEELFRGFGFAPLFRLNLFTIWDSEGVLAGLYRKIEALEPRRIQVKAA